MSTQNPEVRTVRPIASGTGLDISSLMLLATLLAAAFILNMTLGNALAIVGIKPQFIIAAYCLAIVATRPSHPQAVVLGLLSAVVCQVTTSISGLNFVTESMGALAMSLLAGSALSKGRAMPLIAAFVATLVSGLLFATLGNVVMGASMATTLVKLPIVVGTAAFNAIVVQLLAPVVTRASHRR
ncbi:hypothetical protein [uncultured Olsenella sp.]|uniref:hypothetical protein n=1 Tax=uncultured Olsenella sp. TaxID=190764 RepID=UPI0026DAD017|nr:hypothetical protein [uncultured Olsenella sp.]